MRDRLIELIRASGCVETWDYYADDFKKPNPIYELADHLIANGVILPPCKVGQTVLYNPFGNHLLELEIAQIIIEPIAEIGMSFHCCGGVVFDMRDIGKSVFLTREDAEQALKGGDGE